MSQDGVINAICLKLHLIDEPIQYFQNGKYFWWIIAIANTWKGMGYNSINISVCNIGNRRCNIGRVVGAGDFKIWYITLPCLKDTIVIMLILAVGGILNAGFEQQLLMQNNQIMDYALVIDLYSYKFGIQPVYVFIRCGCGIV